MFLTIVRYVGKMLWNTELTIHIMTEGTEQIMRTEDNVFKKEGYVTPRFCIRG